MPNYKIALLLAASLVLTPTAWASEANEVEALRKRVKELEIEALKLRLNLADEKLITTKFEFSTLIIERQRICNELGATDSKTHQARCVENK